MLFIVSLCVDKIFDDYSKYLFGSPRGKNGIQGRFHVGEPRRKQTSREVSAKIAYIPSASLTPLRWGVKCFLGLSWLIIPHPRISLLRANNVNKELSAEKMARISLDNLLWTTSNYFSLLGVSRIKWNKKQTYPCILFSPIPHTIFFSFSLFQYTIIILLSCYNRFNVDLFEFSLLF